ncbi:hypothetical protein Tco_1527933 [Tanacetum coccineum]
MGIPTIGQTGELLPLPSLASIWKDLRVLREIKIELEFSTHTVIKKLSQEKVSPQEALEKFKLTVVCDHEIKVLGEVNVELESGSKKLRKKLRQEEDTEEQAFEEFSREAKPGK